MLENKTDVQQRPDQQGGQFDRLRERLAILQQQMKAEKLPVMVVFEGWGGSGLSLIHIWQAARHPGNHRKIPEKRIAGRHYAVRRRTVLPKPGLP